VRFMNIQIRHPLFIAVAQRGILRAPRSASASPAACLRPHPVRGKPGFSHLRAHDPQRRADGAANCAARRRCRSTSPSTSFTEAAHAAITLPRTARGLQDRHRGSIHSRHRPRIREARPDACSVSKSSISRSSAGLRDGTVDCGSSAAVVSTIRHHEIAREKCVRASRSGTGERAALGLLGDILAADHRVLDTGSVARLLAGTEYHMGRPPTWRSRHRRWSRIAAVASGKGISIRPRAPPSIIRARRGVQAIVDMPDASWRSPIGPAPTAIADFVAAVKRVSSAKGREAGLAG